MSFIVTCFLQYFGGDIDYFEYDSDLIEQLYDSSMSKRSINYDTTDEQKTKMVKTTSYNNITLEIPKTRVVNSATSSLLYTINRHNTVSNYNHTDIICHKCSKPIGTHETVHCYHDNCYHGKCYIK
jgi:hypothetical protein